MKHLTTILFLIFSGGLFAQNLSVNKLRTSDYFMIGNGTSQKVRGFARVIYAPGTNDSLTTSKAVVDYVTDNFLPIDYYTAGDGIDISGGTISNTGDLDDANEIQTLSISGQNLSLSPDGGTVVLPEGISETRVKYLADSLEIAATYNNSGRFIAARKAGKPLVVGFMGDSQFDRYYRNVQHFFASDWASEFTPNGPGYCAASTQAANVEGFGFQPVAFSGTWTEANTITNSPPIVEEGLNGRYAENESNGRVTFTTAAVAEWPNVEKYDSLRVYTKANGAEYDITVDGSAYIAHVVTPTHGGVHVLKVGGLTYSAHTVRITQSVGTLRVYGISAYSSTAGSLTVQRFAQGSSSFESNRCCGATARGPQARSTHTESGSKLHELRRKR